MAILYDIDPAVRNWPGGYQRKQKDANCNQIGLQTLSDQVQQLSSDGSVLPRTGSLMTKYIVRPGDYYASGCYEERALGIWYESPANNDHRYYGWSTLVPIQAVTPASWFILTEVHATDFLQAPYKFRIDGNNMVLRVSGGQVTALPGGGYTYEWDETIILHAITRGLWNDYIVEIDWKTSNTGTLRVYWRLEGQVNYTLVCERLNKKTLQQNPTNGAVDSHYWTQGIYRDKTTGGNNVIYHDGFRMGESYADMTSTSPPVVTPPPPVANSIGNTNNQGDSHGSLVDYVRVCKFSYTGLPSNAVIDSLFMWVEPQSSALSESVKLVAYADNAGEPGAIIGTTEEIVINPSVDTSGWYQFDFPAPLGLTAGDASIWLGDHRGGSGNIANTRKLTSPTSPFRLLAQAYASGPPANWDTANDQAFTVEMAIYTVWRRVTSAQSGSGVASIGIQASGTGTVTGSGPSPGNIVPSSRVIFVPAPNFQPAFRGGHYEIDASGNVIGPVLWDETNDNFYRP